MARHLRSAASLGWLLPLVLLISLSGSGCTLVATGMWVLNPNDTDAEYDGLKHHRVAVVCKATNVTQSESAGADEEIAQQVAKALKENVSKVVIVSQKEVNDWVDHNELKSYTELGKALKVDRVVAIELNQFSLYDGKTIYQGHARARVSVHDVATGDATSLNPLQTTYPPKNGIPADTPEQQFRSKFIGIIANQIARRFYAHDSRQVDDDYYHD